MKRCLSIAGLGLVVLARPTLAQTGTVSGAVLDRQTGDPLVGAIVFLEGTQIGTTCGVEGRFQLLDVPLGTYVLASSMATKTTITSPVSTTKAVRFRFRSVTIAEA